jgi:hypothetical protein
MIKIIDDWYIESESNPVNYIVRRGKQRLDKKGSNRDRVYGYYSSMAKAVKAVRDNFIAEEFSDGSTSLSTALSRISEIDAEFVKIMERVTA